MTGSYAKFDRIASMSSAGNLEKKLSERRPSGANDSPDNTHPKNLRSLIKRGSISHPMFTAAVHLTAYMWLFVLQVLENHTETWKIGTVSGLHLQKPIDGDREIVLLEILFNFSWYGGLQSHDPAV